MLSSHTHTHTPTHTHTHTLESTVSGVINPKLCSFLFLPSALAFDQFNRCDSQIGEKSLPVCYFQDKIAVKVQILKVNHVTNTQVISVSKIELVFLTVSGMKEM